MNGFGLARRIKDAISQGANEVLVEPDDLPRGVDSVEWIAQDGYMRAPVVVRDGLRFVDVSRAKRVSVAQLDDRQFPVLVPRDAKGREIAGCPRSVPWSIVEPHRAQAGSNHGGQTLETLAERGGLSPCELHAVLHDQRWRPMPDLAVPWLVELLEAARPSV